MALVETHLLIHAHCLYLIDVEWRVLFKMAVICQVLIIQSHKYKHTERTTQESTYTHTYAHSYGVPPHLKVNTNTLLSFCSDGVCRLRWYGMAAAGLEDCAAAAESSEMQDGVNSFTTNQI